MSDQKSENAFQVSERVLSPDALLEVLRRYADKARAKQRQFETDAEYWRSSPPEGDWDTATAVENCVRNAAQQAQEAAALEQAIAAIEVLSAPEFNGLTRTRLVDKPFGIFPATPANEACRVHAQLPKSRFCFDRSGVTPMEALLKAHEVLYSSTPKTETEGDKR